MNISRKFQMANTRFMKRDILEESSGEQNEEM